MAEFPEVGLQAVIQGVDEFERSAKVVEDGFAGLAGASEQAGQSSESSAAGLGVLTGVVAGLTTAGIGIIVEGLTALAGAMWEAASAGPEFAAEMDDVTRSLQAQTGLPAEIAEGYMEMAETLFAVGGEGESIGQVSDALALVGQVTDLSGEKLQTLTEHALIFSDTFGTNIDSSVRSTNQVMRLFGEEGVTVFDMMTKAVQETGVPASELTSTVSSFAPAFLDAGFSAEEMFGILTAGVDAGAAGFNQVGFATREFFFNLQDGSDQTRGALETLGIPVDQFLSDLQSGAISGPEAMSAIIQALGGVEDETIQNQVGVQLFGRSWKQLGSEVLLALDPATARLQDYEGAVARADEVTDAGLGATWDRLKRTLQVSLADGFLPILDTLTQSLTPAIESFAGWIKGPGQEALAGFGQMIADEVGPVLANLGPFVANVLIPKLIGLSDWFKNEAIPWFKKTVDFIIGKIIPALEDFAAWIEKEGIPWLEKTVDWIKKEGIPGFKKFIDVMRTDVLPALKKVGDIIVNDLIPAIRDMIEAIRSVIETLARWYKAVSDFVSDVKRAWEDLRAGTEAAWDAIRSAVDSAVNAIQDVVTSTWQAIRSTIEGVLSDIQSAVTAAWNEITAAIRRALSDIATEVSSRWNEILSTIRSILTSIASEVSSRWNEILSTIRSILTGIGSEISTRWNEYLAAIRNALSSIASEVSSRWNEIANVIRNALSNIGSEISSRWNEFLNNIRNVLSSILSEVSAKFQQIYDEVRNKLLSLAAIPAQIASTLIGIGTSIVNYILQGIRGVASFVSDVLAQIQSWFNSIYATIASGFQVALDIGRIIVLKIVQGFKSVVTFVGDVADALASWLSDLASAAAGWWNSAKNLGVSLVNGLIQGIRDQAQDFYDAFSDLINDAVEYAKHLLGISCPDPSPRTAELGIAIAHGLARGIYDGTGAVVQASSWMVYQALAAAQRAAGAYSPSAVFAALGTDLMRGLEQGIAAQVPVVSAQLQAAVSAPALTPAYAAAGGPTVQNFSFNMGGNTIQGGMDQAVFEARVLKVVRSNIR